MNKKPKIAVIGLKGIPAFGGAAAVGENVIEQLKNKYDFTVYSITSHTNLQTGSYNGYKQIVFKKAPFKIINSLHYYIISALHILFYANYDLVHLHHRAALFIIPLIRIKNNLVLTTHGMEAEPKFEQFSSLFSLQDKLFIRFANYITTVSKKDYKIVTGIVKANKVTYIPNGISPLERTMGKNDIKDYLVFAAGRIVKSKGCHTLLSALIKMKFKGKLLIIGDIHQDNRYKNVIDDLSQQLPDVRFTGLIKDKSELLDIISKARLFIYPSYLEAMSMMMLEVASVKTPMICANIPENRDVFESDEVLYALPENVDDFSKKIRWALENPKEMLNKSIRAYNKLVQNYLWETIKLSYDEVYVKLIK